MSFANPRALRSGRVVLIIAVEKERYTKLPFEHTPPK
jgi:hypothetical protein